MSHRVVLAVLAIAVLLGGCGDGQPAGYELEAEFDRTFNLFEGSRVRVLGITVGTVEEITMRPGMETVRVRLRIDEDVRLPADVRASVVFGALLGERHVELHPPYTEGPELEPGELISADRTGVPAEFDEILESLNDFLDGLPPAEIDRLVRNAADVLDGRGEQLGQTFDDLAVAIDVLSANDEAVVSLAARLADLNTTLATRDQAIGAMIEDWNAVLATLAAERDTLDAALDGAARLAAELGDLLETHRSTLETDVRTVTRVTRTLERNIDELDLLVHGQSELYRHAERVFDLERNWLPLVNHSEDLGRVIADRLQNRLAGVCERIGIVECADQDFWANGMPSEICFPPVALCLDDPRRPPTDIPEDEGPVPLPDALRQAIELVPELPGELERLQSADVAATTATLPLLTGTAVR